MQFYRKFTVLKTVRTSLKRRVSRLYYTSTLCIRFISHKYGKKTCIISMPARQVYYAIDYTDQNFGLFLNILPVGIICSSKLSSKTLRLHGFYCYSSVGDH